MSKFEAFTDAAIYRAEQEEIRAFAIKNGWEPSPELKPKIEEANKRA